MESNEFKTLLISEVIGGDFPQVRFLASHDHDGLLRPFISRPINVNPSELVFTFDQLLKKTLFPDIMRGILACLEAYFGCPVDIEFTGQFDSTREKPIEITLLQCRPLSQHEGDGPVRVPGNIPDDDKILSTHRLVPNGVIEHVRYVVLVTNAYHRLATSHERLEVGRVIGRLNERLQGERFILIGPGRWGTSNTHLGVKVSYADIYNALALIEVAMSSEGGGDPEMAYGTHFFQDLVEARIYPLALFPEQPDNLFNQEFFDAAPNLLAEFLPNNADMAGVITVVDVSQVTGGRHLRIVMDMEHDEALGYICQY